MGQFDNAEKESREVLRIAPDTQTEYLRLVWSLIGRNRYDEAKAISEKTGDSSFAHYWRYSIAIVQGDTASAQRESQWAEDNDEYNSLEAMGEHAYFNGRFEEARPTYSRAKEAAQKKNANEAAALLSANQARWEALAGNLSHAHELVAAAIKLGGGRDVESAIALVSAFTGDRQKARSLVSELAIQHPNNTLVNKVLVPEVKGVLEMNEGDPAKAIEILQISRPFDLGSEMNFLPIYLRGEAYLRSRNAPEAESEFEKILKHRGVSLTSPVYPLAQLGLARAYAMQGDTAKARTAYQDFLTLWKAADPDIPILSTAKAEYAKLQ